MANITTFLIYDSNKERNLRKQSFTDALQNKCSYKFREIHRCFPAKFAKFLKATFFTENTPESNSHLQCHAVTSNRICQILSSD